MEVEDEVDMAAIDQLSAILAPAEAEGDAGEFPDEVGNVTITVNTRGEVLDVDQESLNTVLGSGQPSARVTFVRVDDGGQSTIESQIQLESSELLACYGQTDGGSETDPEVNMGLVLNPDLESLEKVLGSDEGKDLLNVEEADVSVGSDKKVETPTRRSQRQVDRETRQAAEKIMAENQESMRRDREAGGKGRGKGGMMRGGSRPGRSRKHPRHSKDVEENKEAEKEAEDNQGEGENEEEEDEEDEEEEEEEDSESGSWVSEDDPDRLWCICQKPHNNRFMICCDTCLNWFHGICVGITKAQGKEMELAGKDWKCPGCLKGLSRDSNQAAAAAKKESADSAVVDDIDELLNDDLEDEFLGSGSSPAKVETPEKSKLRRKSSLVLEEPERKKEKGPSCHLCSNPPLANSLYCSDACIIAHTSQALALLSKDGKSGKASPVVVLEPKSNTLINGHRAPTQSSLKSWLLSHKTYHVVMPSKGSLNKAQAASTPSKERSGPKIISAHREEKKAQKIGDIIKKRPVKSREEMVAETKAALRRSVSTQDGFRSQKRERRSSESIDRRPTPVKRKPVEKPVVEYEYKEPKHSDNSSALRSTVTKGVRDALLEKLKKSDLEIEDKKVMKIAEEIEIAMFGTFGDVGPKYKNKYRSLTYNIKDKKNDGLFRRILLKDLQPIEVVQMSADEYASKELQQWRKEAAQKDIEAIKSHELDMLALGNTFVMKSHKGEQVIEKSDELQVTSSSEPVLPEEQDTVKEPGPSRETWEHPNHGELTIQPLCHVCNGKMSLEDFVMAKLEKEKVDAKKKKERERRHKDKHRERHSSSKSHSHSHSSKDKKHSRDREKSSHRSSNSSDKDRKHSSKSHSSSSSSKSRKEKSKEKERSSASSGEKSKETSKPATTTREEQDRSDLQAQISKATAAIEAAKKSQSEPAPQPEVMVLTESTSRPGSPPGSPLDLDLPMDPEGGWLEGEVSSTVTIPTPEQSSWAGETRGEPSVWEGQVIMLEVAKFSVSAFQVSGTSDYLSVDLTSSLELVGRIPPSVCWDYIDKIGKNPTKEILVLKLWPSNNDEKESYNSFFQYLSTRDRFGVVGNCNKNVKDCYIMPLRATQPVPEGLLPMSGQGLPLTRPDLLLSIIVRTKRSRAAADLSSSLMSVPAPLQPPRVAAETRSITAGLPALPLARGGPAPAPAPAPEDDSSPYSPAGSSPEISEPAQTSSVADQFSEQLARLQREVAAKRAELALREQQQQHRPAMFQPNLPPTSPPFLPPGPGGSSSTLSRMSEDDLLAAAAAMEHHGSQGSQGSPTKQSLPPPGPGMPGNLIGQGMANIELAREEQGYGGYGGGWDSRGGFRGFYRGRGGGGEPGPGWVDRRGRGGGGGGGWGDRRGRGGWERGRDRDHGDWGGDRRDERRDRRDERERGGRGGWRERERWGGGGGGDYRRDRRDYDRRDSRDYRDSRERDRERNRPRHDSRRYEEGERGRPSLATEDWSDEEIRVESDNSSQNTSSVHLDVQEEIANFDKQFLPKSGE